MLYLCLAERAVFHDGGLHYTHRNYSSEVKYVFPKYRLYNVLPDNVMKCVRYADVKWHICNTARCHKVMGKAWPIINIIITLFLKVRPCEVSLLRGAPFDMQGAWKLGSGEGGFFYTSTFSLHWVGWGWVKFYSTVGQSCLYSSGRWSVFFFPFLSYLVYQMVRP